MPRWALIPLAVLIPLLGTAAAADPVPERFSKIAVIHLREDADEAIDDSVKESVLRRIELARNWGADCIVFDIESYGGYVHSATETADEIFALGRTVPTFAYVGRKAISGAAMISIACREIVMSESALIGDSQVIFMAPGAGGIQVAPEKMQTAVAANFRKYAAGNGVPVPLAEAMVRQEMEVTRYRKPNDPLDPDQGSSWVYFRTDTLGDGPSRREMEEMRLFEPEVVVREGELATFTANEALDYGVARRSAPTLDAFLDSIKAEGAEVGSFDWTWAEKTSRWLLGVRFLLFLIGMGALYFALKTPGTGVPEALALVCFGLFFGASAVSQLAGMLEVVLFLGGLLLLAIEIFLLPGFGVPGLLGLAAILGAVALAAIPEGGSYGSGGVSTDLLTMARDFLLGSFAALLVVFYLLRNLPKVPFLKRLHLEAALPQTGSAVGGGAYATGRPHPLVGERGVAETTLRPSGRAKIAGEHRDVVAEGAYVEAGTAVRVVAVRGNVIIVRAEPGV